jgi:hypothetical protein
MAAWADRLMDEPEKLLAVIGVEIGQAGQVGHGREVRIQVHLRWNDV